MKEILVKELKSTLGQSTKVLNDITSPSNLLANMGREKEYEPVRKDLLMQSAMLTSVNRSIQKGFSYLNKVTQSTKMHH